MVKLVLVDTRAGRRPRARSTSSSSARRTRCSCRCRTSCTTAGSASAPRCRWSSTCRPSRTTTRARRIPAGAARHAAVRLDAQGWLRSSSPAAPGSSAATSSATRSAAHPDWHVTTLDKLTYAGRRENLHDVMDASAAHVRARRHRRSPRSRRRSCEAPNIVVHFAAETHVDRSLMSAGDFIQTDVYGTFVLLEAARQAQELRRFVQISTDEVYGSVPTGVEPRDRRAEAAQPVLGEQGRRRSARLQLLGDLRRAGHRDARVEQLRSVPVSREGHPAVHHQRDRRHPGAALRRRPATCATGCTCSDHCRAHRPPARAGRAGRGLQHRRRQRGRERRPDARASSSWSGKPESLITPGRRSARPRSPLRLDTRQAAGARLGAAQSPFEEGLARHRRLVPAERVVVAADQGSGPGLPGVLRSPVRRTPRLGAVAGLPLVTGAAGFAGSHLLDQLLEREPVVDAWAHRRRPPAPRATASFARPRWTCSTAPPCTDARRLQPVDRLSLRRCRRRRHLVDGPGRALRVNVMGTHHLLEGVRDAGLQAQCRHRLRGGLPRPSTRSADEIRSDRRAPTASASWRRR